MPLKIDFITETYPPEINGVAMTVGRLVDGLRAAGHLVRVIRPRQGEYDAGAGTDLLLPGCPLPGYAGLRFGWPAARRLRQVWRNEAPDLVHVITEGPLGWSAVKVARAAGIAVTSGFHTNFDRYSVHYGLGWLRPLVAAYLRTLHRRTWATLVPTEALAAELAGQGLPGVRVVGRGVDTALFDPARRSDALRATWLAGPETPVCLYVGRLAPEKNLDQVEASFAAVRARHPAARMVWIGDGPAERGLRQRHPDHHFAGRRIGEDLAAHYASADLFLFPSLSETYGNVVSEAMASGLAVVAYRSAAAAELIVHGINGMSVTPGDGLAFSQAVIDLLDAPGARQRQGKAARSTVAARSWSAVVAAFEQVAKAAVSAQNSACTRKDVMSTGPRSAL